MIRKIVKGKMEVIILSFKKLDMTALRPHAGGDSGG